MNITYKRHEETEKTKPYTDIILNGKDIGYYVIDENEFTVELYVDGFHYVEDFNTEEDLKTNIKYYLEQC